jgi:hypothetical protein
VHGSSGLPAAAAAASTRGSAGGLALRDLSENARLSPAAPSVVRTAPESDARDMSPRSRIVIRAPGSALSDVLPSDPSLYFLGGPFFSCRCQQAIEVDS